MKLRLYLKDREGIINSVTDAVEENLDERLSSLSVSEKNEIIVRQGESLLTICEQWTKYNQSIIIEIDTEKNTAIVVPTKDRM